MPRNHCYITPKDGDIYIECPYDEEFLEVFKAAIPSSDREWEGDLKRWWVSGAGTGHRRREFAGRYLRMSLSAKSRGGDAVDKTLQV